MLHSLYNIGPNVIFSAEPVLLGVLDHDDHDGHDDRDDHDVSDYTYSACPDDSIRMTYLKKLGTSVFKDVFKLTDEGQPAHVTVNCG